MEKYIHFFNNVMVNLGYYDWSIRFCSDSYCWNKSKRIDICLDYMGDIYQLILHEIAHIDTCKYNNQAHNPVFWKRLEYLVWKFLKEDLDEYQEEMKKYITTGIYKLCYKRV